MAGTRALYEQVILDHAKNPRNFRALEPCDCKCEGFNPLCGDQFTIYLRLDGDIIKEVGFTGAGCAISKSSASVMTTILKGKTIPEARALFTRFHQMVTSEPNSPLPEDALGKLAVFGGVRDFPVRIKCATLAWHTLSAALDGKDRPISTE